MKGTKRKRSTPQQSGPRRSFFGNDAYLEIIIKVVTLCFFGFSIYVYFDTIHPTFKKERELRATQEKLVESKEQLGEVTRDRLLIRQDLEKYQAQEPAAKRGIFLDYLLATKRRLQEDAERYQREGTPIDLRQYCLTNLHSRLTLFKAPVGDPLGTQRFKALRFLESFIEAKIPAGAVDASALDGIYLYLEEQGKVIPAP